MKKVRFSKRQYVKIIPSVENTRPWGKGDEKPKMKMNYQDIDAVIKRKRDEALQRTKKDAETLLHNTRILREVLKQDDVDRNYFKTLLEDAQMDLFLCETRWKTLSQSVTGGDTRNF